MEVDEEISETEIIAEDDFNPLFEKEGISLSELKSHKSAESQKNPSTIGEILAPIKSEDNLPSESYAEPIPSDHVFTSHPIAMKVENSNIKMVDLTYSILTYRELPIAPDGFIPNSEIRLILKRPFQDCLPPKKLQLKSKKDDSKKLFEEILLKYLPEDLITEPQHQLQTVQDMALLAESKTARNKVITLDDTDDLNKDLVDQIDVEEDIDGMIQNISMRTAKSKRKKYARQITKAAMLNQLEKKIKEKEEKRKEQILRDEEKLKNEREEEDKKNLLEDDQSKELIDIDILDTLDKNLNDELSRERLIALKKEKELKKLEAAFSTIDATDLINMLFNIYGEEKTYKYIYGAMTGDLESINLIDAVVKTRQSRLAVLSAILNNPYIFSYLAVNLDGEDKLINIGIMMDDTSLVDKSTLTSMQEKVAEILGNETKMVQYLAKLNWTLNCASEKLKLVTDEPTYDLIRDLFCKKEEAFELLKVLLGGVEKRNSFIRLLKNCDDVEIQNFSLPKDQIKAKSSLTKQEKRKSQKSEFDVDFYGDLTDEERKLLPALPDGTTESPHELAGRIAKVLQSKRIKIENEATEINEIITEDDHIVPGKKEAKIKKLAKTKSVNEEMLHDADKAVQKSLSGVPMKKPKYLDDIAKSELGLIGDEVEHSKSLKIIGQPKDDGASKKKSHPKIKTSDLLNTYHDKLINQDWWPSGVKMDATADSMFMALVIMLYNTGKLANHTDVCQFIIEIKKMFTITKETKNEAINKLYEYFKEDREGAIKAKNEKNQSSHIFYCKRVLNVLGVLKSLDEDVDEFREDFINKYGQIEGFPRIKYAEKEETKMIEKEEIKESPQARYAKLERPIKAPTLDTEKLEKVTPTEGGEKLKTRPSDGGEKLKTRPSDGGEKLKTKPSDGGEKLKTKPSDGGEKLKILPSSVGEILKVLTSEAGEKQNVLISDGGEKGKIQTVDGEEKPKSSREAKDGKDENEIKSVSETKESRDSRKKIREKKDSSRDMKYRQPVEEVDIEEAKERAKNLIDTLKNSSDPKEQKVITSAIQTLFKSESFPVSIKQSLMEETSAYFNEVKVKLEESLKDGVQNQEQLKLYQELLQSTEILNSIAEDVVTTADGKEEHEKQSLIKIPSLYELRSDPKLLVEAKSDVTDKIFKPAEQSIRSERSTKLDASEISVKSEKLDKVMKADKMEKQDQLKKGSKTDNLDREQSEKGFKLQIDGQRSILAEPPFSEVIEGKRLLDQEKELIADTIGTKVDTKFDDLGMALSDKISYKDGKPMNVMDSVESSDTVDREGNIIEETPVKKQERIERKHRKEAARKLIRDKRAEMKLSKSEDISALEQDEKLRDDLGIEKKEIDKEIEKDGQSIVPETEFKEEGKQVELQMLSKDDVRPEKEISPTASTGAVQKQDDQMYEGVRETNDFKGHLFDSGFGRSSKPPKPSVKSDLETRENIFLPSSTAQSLLRDLFSSIENKLTTDKIDSTDPQLISKILAEQLIASQIDPDQLGNISREMIQTFMDKVPMMDSTKQGLEEILITNIEKLILKFSDEKAASFDKKSELFEKLHDVSSILKTLEIEPSKMESSSDNDLNSSKLKQESSTSTGITTFIDTPVVSEIPSFKQRPLKPINAKEEEVKRKRIKQNMLNHLRKHFVQSKADLTLPAQVIHDLLKQKDKSGKDPSKVAQIALALYDISQDPLVDNEEIMEMIASNSFSNLITDMQNILSQSLKQYDIPISLDRSTTNLLLLLDIGVEDLDDFKDEIQTFSPLYPDEVDFSKNPLSQLTIGEHKLKISKNDIIIDDKLNFLRNVNTLKPMDQEKGYEMGLMIRHSKSDDGNLAITSVGSSKKLASPIYPTMFNVTKAQSKKLNADYSKKEELKLKITEIENVIKMHERKIDMMIHTRDSLDSLVEMARDQKPGSKTRLMNLICKSPALKALATMNPLMDFSGYPSVVSKSKPESLVSYVSRPGSPSIKLSKNSVLPPIGKSKRKLNDMILQNAHRPDYFHKIEMLEDHDKAKQREEKRASRARKLSQLKKIAKNLKYKVSTEMKVHAKVERRLTNYGQPDIAELIAKKTEYYGSIDALRTKIKDEISKEYSNFVKRIDFDASDSQQESNMMSEPALIQTKKFQKFYGKNTTLLPFIGKSKSLVGNVLDQGLRALHFNLGPGTLVKAIMENQKIATSSDSKYDSDDWWTDGSKKITEVMQVDHSEHAEPRKYLTMKQLMHCRMTSRPCCIPVHEWSKVAIAGTRRNLRPELFCSYHKNSHCAYQVLAHKYLHRHGISIAKHLERYEILEIINKSVQENAYIRIQNSLLKCLMRVLEEK